MSDVIIRWDPLFPVTISVLVAVVVLAALIILEVRRKLRYKPIRIICQCLVVASVLLLSLRPSTASKSEGNSILLITDGATDAMVDSLKRANPGLTELNVNSLTSLNDLSKFNISLIAGNGLPSWALDLLSQKNFQFIPSESIEGISGIDLPDHVYANRWNKINGTYDLAGESSMLKLRGPGGVEDSVELKGPGTVPFSLSYFSKAPGRFNYDIVALASPSHSPLRQSEAGTETLPVVIEPERQFNILFIADYPTFEVRYLKNFLASKGHRLSVRNQVSRGRYKLEFANRPSMSFQTLSTTILNDADLLVIDEPSWHTLSGAEQKNLRNSIQNGLGVVVIPQSQHDKNRSQLIQFTSNNQKDTARVSLDRAGSFLLPALPMEVKQSAPLLASNERVLTGYVHSGAGKIGYQLLNETYQVGLQGKTEAYSSIWVPLLEKCARSNQQDFKIRITSPFPFYENHPIEFDIISSGKEPHARLANSDVPLNEDAYIDDLWHGKVWLEGPTWHQFFADSVSTWVPLAKNDSWNALNNSNNRKATSLRAGTGSPESTTQVVYSDHLLKIVLFTLFILASGFLWLAPKL